MTYCSSNILADFEFHDAYLKFEKLEQNELTVSAKHLNVRKNTDQNDHPTDMEIDAATIVFSGFSTVSFEPGRAWVQDENGKSHPEGPQIVFEGREAEEKFLDELCRGVTVYHFVKLENGNFCIDGCGKEPYFTVCFSFDLAQIRWDKFRKPAWYEEKSFKK